VATTSDYFLAWLRAQLGVSAGSIDDLLSLFLSDPKYAAKDLSDLVTGQESIPRLIASGSSSPVSGTLRLTYFTARKTETINNVRTQTGSTAAATTTLARIGLYSVTIDETGGTLLASTANDVNLWNAANTGYTKAFTAPIGVNAGQRYALGMLFVGTTPPTIIGSGSNQGLTAEAAQAPRLTSAMTGQADLPGTLSGLSSSGMALYGVITP